MNATLYAGSEAKPSKAKLTTTLSQAKRSQINLVSPAGKSAQHINLPAQVKAEIFA